jgi:hypothetical protein
MWYYSCLITSKLFQCKSQNASRLQARQVRGSCKLAVVENEKGGANELLISEKSVKVPSYVRVLKRGKSEGTEAAEVSEVPKETVEDPVVIIRWDS